jgi:hypothetical protein
MNNSSLKYCVFSNQTSRPLWLLWPFENVVLRWLRRVLLQFCFLSKSTVGDKDV